VNELAPMQRMIGAVRWDLAIREFRRSGNKEPMDNLLAEGVPAPAFVREILLKKSRGGKEESPKKCATRPSKWCGLSSRQGCVGIRSPTEMATKII
jgi:hypothetical protein